MEHQPGDGGTEGGEEEEQCGVRFWQVYYGGGEQLMKAPWSRCVGLEETGIWAETNHGTPLGSLPQATAPGTLYFERWRKAD